MILTFVTVLFIAVMFIFGCFIYVIRKIEKNDVSSSIKYLLLSACVCMGFYGSAILVRNDMVSSFLFSAYNAVDDIVILLLLRFAKKFTGTGDVIKGEKKVFIIAIAADAIILFLNPLTELMYTCASITDNFGIVFHYISKFKFLYSCHLVIMYIGVILTFGVLGRKISSTPKIYKMKYAAVLISICPVIAVNAILLNFETKFDYSILFYTVIAFSVFYFSLVYVPRGLMERLLFFSVANMRYGIICIDIDGKCVHANKTARIYCDAEVDSENVEEQVKKWYAEKVPSEQKDCSWQSVRRVDGKMRHYSIEYKQMFDNSFRYIGCFFLIDDHTEDDEKLAAEKYRATHDTLTGIYNREYFYEAARKLIDSTPDTDYCMVCTDVKNFKLINDIFGIAIGDRLLKEIASITAKLADNKCTYGRLTSDRFAICFPKNMLNENTLLYEYSKVSNFIQNSIFKIRIHIGIYEIDQRDAGISVMCDRANLAIKTIKDSYQNVIAYYDNNLRSSVMKEQKVIGEFETAMSMGQFLIYIQPQVSAGGYIRGGEALVRWNHPDDGIIPPGKFISILEKTGLISKLDAYMWELSCIQLRKWLDAGMEDIYISVNISPKDFYLIDVYDVITGLVKKYSLNPKSLHLEITETAVMSNPRQQLALINKLRKFGFLIEIDDFGSGYSSLNTLKDITADVLKIDMGFLESTSNIEKSRTILQMVISLAKSLNMEVITEGVENKQQADFLAEAGCDIFQGYHFAQPVSVSEFESKYLFKCVEV